MTVDVVAVQEHEEALRLVRLQPLECVRDRVIGPTEVAIVEVVTEAPAESEAPARRAAREPTGDQPSRIRMSGNVSMSARGSSDHLVPRLELELVRDAVDGGRDEVQTDMCEGSVQGAALTASWKTMLSSASASRLASALPCCRDPCGRTPSASMEMSRTLRPFCLDERS